MVTLDACVSDGPDSCDPETIGRAVEFVESHQSCAADDDCVIISDYCEQLPSGYCGKLLVNRVGAESAEWNSITDKLDHCAPDDCVVCLGPIDPICKNGTCADYWGRWP